MTVTPEQKFADVVSAVSDGEAVDWASVEGRATTERDRAFLTNLRTVAAVAEAHGSPQVTSEHGTAEGTQRGGLDHGSSEDATTVASRYRVLEPLGRGGMGSVWRSVDVSLRREVALKFLSAELSSQQEFRLRFLREARVAAALAHGNVCTIYEVGEVERDLELSDHAKVEAGTPFLAMERVTGRSLAVVLAQEGKLAVDRLLAVAVQVAEGLAAAHSQGIVHRDLKPGNVMLTPDGKVKMLDFGLARPLPAPRAIGNTTDDSGPPASDLTRNGQVLGTLAYMSPEQAQGKPVDTRSDIFSFGTLLYELATGIRPFQADNPASTAARIIERDPPSLLEHDSTLPVQLDWLIRRCLAKNPEDRYQDTRDLVGALRDLREGVTTGALKPATGRGQRLLTRVARALALVATGAVAGGLVVGWIVCPSGDPGDELARAAVPGTALPSVFQDDFDTTPDPGIAGGAYEVLNLDPDTWKPDVRAGFLTLWTHRGDVWLKPTDPEMPVRNMVVRPCPPGDVRVTTRLDFSPVRHGQQAGLLLLADADNYYRLVMGATVSGTPVVEVVIERDGDVLEASNRGIPYLRGHDRPTGVHLRIERLGPTWTLRFSPDGVRYFTAGEWRIPIEPRWIALAAFHGVTQDDLSPRNWDSIPAHFDFLRIEPSR